MNPVTFAFHATEKINSAVPVMPTDFTLYADGKPFPVNSFIASTLSHKILMLIMENSNANEYTINDVSSESMSVVVSYLNAKIPDVNLENCDDVFKAATQLVSQKLADAAMGIMLKEKSPADLIPYINYGIEHHINVMALTDFVAKNFKSVQNELKSVSEYGLELILKSIHLKASEDDVFNVLKNNTAFQQDATQERLIKFVPGKYISEFNKILLKPMFNLNQFRWTLIANKNTPTFNKKNTFEIIYEGDPMDGIIRSGIFPAVAATSVFSPKYAPQNVLNDDDSYYCSAEDNGMLVFDFSPYKITVYGYALRSWRLGANGTCPRSFAFFAFNEKGILVLQHEENNCKDLVGHSASKYFPIKGEPLTSSKFALSQKETNNPGNERFVISCIEFFGKVSK